MSKSTEISIMNNGKHKLDPLRDLINERLVAVGISAREASKRAGFNPGFLGNFLSKKAKSSNVEGLSAIAKMLGIDDPFDNPHIGDMSTEKSNGSHTNRKPLNAQTSMVPLFSVAVQSGGQFMRVPDNPAGFVPTLPALEHIGGAYAFTVPNDMNEPRYMPGEIVYVSPAAAAREGDFVFVRLANGTAGVSRLMGVDGERITLRALKASRAQTVMAKDIVVMHRIVAAIG